jgi:arylsulfatase A-like enzyme
MPYRRLPQLLSDAGYETGVFGKWHLGSQEAGPDYPRKFGFDDYCIWDPRDGRERRYRGGLLLTSAGPEAVDDATYTPDYLNLAAIRFVQRKRQNPFFLYYPTLLVHTPVHRPPGARAERGVSDLRLMVERLDEVVGRLVGAVHGTGAREQTLIILTSDNGGAGAGKGTLTDGGTRVPCLMQWPGVIPADRASQGLVDFSDFLPTLCDLASCDPGAVGEGSGRSFAAHLISAEPARATGSSPNGMATTSQGNIGGSSIGMADSSTWKAGIERHRSTSRARIRPSRDGPEPACRACWSTFEAPGKRPPRPSGVRHHPWQTGAERSPSRPTSQARVPSTPRASRSPGRGP